MIKIMMAKIIKLLKQIFNKLDGRACTGFMWRRIWAGDWLTNTGANLQVSCNEEG